MAITTVGFDADDTLWHNESFFRLSQDRIMSILVEHAERERLEACLLAAERRNIGHYGYGVKGFTLSLIETAIEVTEGRVPASVIAQIVEMGRDLLNHPLQLLPHAREVVEGMASSHRLILITKGDLLHQERKLAQSGLGDLFDGVEIVSEKTAETYARIFAQHGDGADRAVMVGNSLKSDVLPALQAGSYAVHIPHGETWALEWAEPPEAHPRFHSLVSLRDFADLVGALG